MLTLHTLIEHADRIDGHLVLPYELREKCRLRTRLEDGEEVAVFTVRGTVLRDGQLLRGSDGRVVRVTAAAEPVLTAQCSDGHALLRCAFHLGNRHAQVQIGDGFLRLRHDPVLRDMLQGLGASVRIEAAPFEPEAGAYSHGGGGHDHGTGLLAPVPLRQKIHRPSDPS